LKRVFYQKISILKFIYFLNFKEKKERTLFLKNFPQNFTEDDFKKISKDILKVTIKTTGFIKTEEGDDESIKKNKKKKKTKK
jgi:hypothetical protein